MKQVQDLRVLVVDDQAAVRLVVERMLRRLGVAFVALAGDGLEAGQLIADADRPFDLVLCDLGMPTEDGLVLLRRLATLDPDLRPAVALVSGRDQLLLESAQRLGRSLHLMMLGALAKPLSLAALGTVLDRCRDAVAAAPAADAPALSNDDLRAALDRGEFEVWFQPQYHLSLHRATGVEALLRLRHPERGLLTAGHFIPQAEHAGLINDLTDVLMRDAMAWAAGWRAAGHTLSLSLNLSKAGLTDLTLPDRAAKLCAEHGLGPGNVTFELTESSLASDTTALLDIAARLRLKGFRLSLDDFGVGYASLEDLRSLPFQELKLDQRFVQAAGHDSRSLKILESSIALANKLHMTTVAEGVETEAMLALVSALGCAVAQGHLIAAPMSGAALLPWLAQPTLPVTPSGLAGGPAAPAASSTASERIVSRFAHDAASPLLVAITLSEMLAESLPESSPLRHDAEQIHAAAEEISALIAALRKQIKDAR